MRKGHGEGALDELRAEPSRTGLPSSARGIGRAVEGNGPYRTYVIRDHFSQASARRYFFREMIKPASATMARPSSKMVGDESGAVPTV